MRLLSLFLIAIIPFSGMAQEETACFPKPQNPPKLVNDFASVLNPKTVSMLEQNLVNFNDTTSTQIAIVTLKDLCGYEPATFAFALGENWGVGNKEFNNGIVILLKPKQGNQKGEVFIATGYGLEGVLPDATTKRIVEAEMIPHFKRNDYDGGIVAAARVIMDITGGEYSAENYNKNKKSGGFPFFPLFFILFFVIIMFAGTFSRARKYANRNDVSLWAALMLMGTMNSRHSGHYNNFSSGRGGFGGGGGGGFGGFGGGSFGGGGAGGSW